MSGSNGWYDPQSSFTQNDPSTWDPNTVINPMSSGWGNDTGTLTGGSASGGGMNWAGLSTGLANLSKNLSGTSGSNTLQTSPSVSSTVSGGQLAPAGGRDSGALASMLNSRNQLAQALINAAMTGKGRGRGGGGLLG
jgi:hypothetical protein